MSKKKLWLWGTLIIGAILLFTLVLAPIQSRSQLGSSYHRGPSGYAAWYNWMQQDLQVEINRWQKPVRDLSSPSTLIQVHSGTINSVPIEWARQGNTLIVLGFSQPVTASSFSSRLPTSIGEVRIDTRRRADQLPQKTLLGDNYGAVVWVKEVGDGKIIYSTTPYLGANAYQDYFPNFQFLAQLVTQSNQPIWFDEYIHGYRDPEIVREETGNSLYRYLASTPWLPVLIQLLMLFLLAIWAGLRPLGIPLTLTKSKLDNSLTYIQALGAVLSKANKSEYIQEIIGKHQQKQLQKALGLGEIPLDHSTLIHAWVKYTDKSPEELNKWLVRKSSQKPLTQTELLAWVIQGQKIYNELNDEAK